jgi:hypothetical protein
LQKQKAKVVEDKTFGMKNKKASLGVSVLRVLAFVV